MTDMSDLSPQARALLNSARSFDDPNDDDARRVRAVVLARVGAAVGVGVAVGATASAVSFAGVGSFLGTATGKVSAAVLLVAGLSAGTYVAVRPRVAVRNVPVVLQQPSPAVVGAPPIQQREARAIEAAPVAPLPDSHAKARPLPAPAAKVAQPRRTTADLEGEVRLLEEADAELRRGDAEAAAARLAEHSAKYPSGALVDEREAMRAMALCRLGRVAEGKAVADRFLSATRKSSLAARVRVACGLEKPTN
jgi:hypothetical protein